jgi:hypothetical protein
MRNFVVLAGIAAVAMSTMPLTALAQTSTTTVTTTATVATMQAHPKKRPQPQFPVQRSASGTIIQPTRTIIHNPNGTTTVIVVPRRSYLDPGTEVPVGYPGTNDYAFPPGGDAGRQYWYFGPDTAGIGGAPLAQPWLIPGFSPNNPTPY